MARRRTVPVLLALALVVAVLPALVPVLRADAGSVTTDGSSAGRAAASCWEVKQVRPAARDGVYWLRTPRLQAPGRFFCDMTTDGGGWVLVGRGRDGWLWGGDAQGTPAQVSDTVTGPGAFSPRHLSGAMIDGLLDGRRLDSLADAVRLRRATNAGGTRWQEVRLRFASRDRWSWAFGAGHPLTAATVGGTTVRRTTTRDVAADDGYRRVWTFESASNGWRRGFVFGSSGLGSSRPSSHVFSTVTGGRYGVPFTQVFVRPRLRTPQLSYPAIPDRGTSAQAAPPLARSGALASSWGVTGLGSGGTGEQATPVQAFAQIGRRVYVGGNFTTVQRGPAPGAGDRVAQPYLAAFDAGTGDWVTSFRPHVDGQVKSLAALPDGRLAVGGDFSRVGGAAHAGLAVLDPVSGRADPAFTTQVRNRLKRGVVSVRALEVSGRFLYLAGAFTHVARGAHEVFARSAARVDLTTGRGDGGWNPDLNGTVADLDVSHDGTQVYLAGWFTRAGTVAAPHAVALGTGPRAVVARAWRPTFSTAGPARYQQAVQQVGGLVWLGGSQHSMVAYRLPALSLAAAHVTRAGGDLQVVASNRSLVYGGCHCGDWTYSGTSDYDALRPGQTTVSWSQADKIAFVGAWDASTGAYLPEFAPQWRAAQGRGAWSLLVASDGTLWAGGTFTSVVREDGRNQWVGGFARFAVRPSSSPSPPSGARVSLERGTATVTWRASPTRGVVHEVLRDDRVVGTTSGTSLAVSGSDAGDRFFVRASDGRGNRSASTAVVTAR